VSASIPVAVISLTIFRLIAKLGGRDATILEHNIVQTAGSAGESIAFGVGVTMPAILILGFDLEIARVLLVSVLGGLLGILMMIPLRRALIVEQHGTLVYPEGTACAEVLKAGCSAQDRAIASSGEIMADDGIDAARGAKVIFGGFAIGIAYKVAMVALKAWKDVPELVFGKPFVGGSVSAEISPELLGVGYIIGPRIASIMCAGGVLAYLVLIPAIKFFGAPGVVIAPGTMPITDMSPDDIRGAYVLYIGAGAVAAGGIVSMIRSLPTIAGGIRGGWRAIAARSADPAANRDRPRTDRDLSPRFVAIGLIGMMAAILLARPLHMNVVGALLIVFTGFLFVTVSSRLTGEVGSTSNPISGMTVATLLVTCLVFLALGWTGPTYYVTALSVGAIVCIASSNGGTTSQDLKTGFLIGSTPRAQQIAIIIGALASALALGPVLLALNQAGTVLVPVAQAGPAAAAMPRLPASVMAGLPEEVAGGTRYRVWRHPDAAGTPQRYLVDPSGKPELRDDPGINGTHRTTAEGAPVQKFDAPKATLMSYIIKGILNHQLPWGLVLLGVMIALVLEMAGVSSLVFAVGVYLPLSSTTPIFAGGAVRWLVDRRRQRREPLRMIAELSAEGDRGPGVLLASGYIAGGAIAGIVIAFMSGILTSSSARIDAAMKAVNPFYGGPWADLLSLLPFAAILAILYVTAARSQPSPE
ncbi:MAG: oligopeptide transporter, family, partial [Alphaproteobacteria bacterium]|nr:oligopeptide transporter, family [Alphaproteobacteria bacterium]